MEVSPILPIPGVSEELIRVLNERFRLLSSPAPAKAKGSVAGLFFPTKNRPDAIATPLGTFGADTTTGAIYQVQTVLGAQSWVAVVAAGISPIIVTDKLTAGGALGSMTFSRGVLTAQTQAT